jgi:hypothetical protein
MDRKNFHPAIFVSALCGICIGVLGCQKEEIQSYLPPKPVEVTDVPDFPPGPRERMLAALVPHGDEVWFLKLQGPEKVVSAHKIEFDDVLRSFRFVDNKDEPVTWTTPKGWTVQPKTQMRYATLLLDNKDAPLELSITQLPRPPDGGWVVNNVNRWRKQLGLNPVTGMDLHKVTTEVKLQAEKAIAVDMVGVPDKAAAMSRMPPGHEAMADAPPAEKTPEPKPFDYTLPSGWKPVADKGGPIRTAGSFVVVEGDQEALVTITRLAGQSGSLAMNIDRWRGQLGLPAARPEELKPSGELKVGGIVSPYLDLTGPKANGRDPKRMLVAIVTQGDSIWYFKMIGSAELVSRQKTTFEAFMSSVRFQGGSHG